MEKQRLAALMKQEGNRRCMDCDSPSPNWASANLGVFICLECSGVHRGLGVQTSFVRSVTMDRWTSEQVAKMELAGNAKATDFFKGYDTYRDNMPIREKYNSEFAHHWRERLAALADGREWVKTEYVPPKAKTAAAAASIGGVGSSSLSGGGSSSISGGGYSGNSGNSRGFGSDGPGRSMESALSSREAERNFKSSLDDSPDPLAMLSRGWGFLSKTVSTAAKSAQENYGDSVSSWTSKISEDARQAYESAARMTTQAAAGAGVSGSAGGAAGSGASGRQPTQNESFFARLGQANASRPDNLPPSQGGKYQGFGGGSAPPPAKKDDDWKW